MEEEEEIKDTFVLPEAKLKKLRNLKYFKQRTLSDGSKEPYIWTDEEITQWAKLRDADKKMVPTSPDVLLPESATPSEETTEAIKKGFDEKEYQKKYNVLLAKYRKEYAVDMNETNDAEALRSLVRYVIQLENADQLIMKEQSANYPDHRTLKGLGDFQRSIQMNVNELQDKLGISRKARKEKSVNDIPEYINSLQAKAREFWQRKTIPVKCNKCEIELVRYWENFPDLVERVQFDLTCEKCHEKVTYNAGRG